MKNKSEVSGANPGGQNKSAMQREPSQSRNPKLDELRHKAIEEHQKGELAAAKPMYALYLNHRPQDATIWTNLGVLMRQEGQHEQALRFQEKAYRLRPDLWNVKNNLANSLGDMGFNQRAAVVFRELLDENSDDPATMWNLGRHLRAQGQYEPAIAELKAGCKKHPDDAQMRLQLALTQLSAGNYAQGFRSYWARFASGELEEPKVDLPKWKGQPLAGKSLLVFHEQGLGDTILCARFLPALKAQGARVHWVCRPQVHRLLAGNPDLDGVSEKVPEGQKFDYWANMFDLPTYYFTKGAGIPGPAKLSIPKDSLARADAIIAPHRSRVRVGVVWSGSVTYNANYARSFSHRELLPLSEMEGVQLFSLYKGPLLEEYLADASNAMIIDAASTDADLADCAATVSRMNLVITADTAVAHIAGSLGVEVWCLLHWDPFWLYGHSSEWTPWYRKMRLYRQTEPRDWRGVFDRVRGDLEARLRATSQQAHHG